jgi:hypothetical protein
MTMTVALDLCNYHSEEPRVNRWKSKWPMMMMTVMEDGVEPLSQHWERIMS